MNDDAMRRQAPDPRAAVVRTLVARETEALGLRFGTAWSIRRGYALRNATHSRFDVLNAATELARELAGNGLLDPAAIPLAQLAAVFHAHGGTCGDGAERALNAMGPWRRLFDPADRGAVATAIEGLRGAGAGAAPRQETAERLGSGIAGDALGGMPTADVLAAIVADADRAHLGRLVGLHRILLNVAEEYGGSLHLPNDGDGRELALDPALVGVVLEHAADTLDGHRWVLEVSSRHFPLAHANAAKVREAAARMRLGELTWRSLFEQADRASGRP